MPDEATAAMPLSWKTWLERVRPKHYGRKPTLILINGLAEQAESWFRNRRYWSRFFDVHAPNILAFEGDALHRRIAPGEPISVDYLVEQLHTYLDQFVQTPPYHLVSSSLGGKIAVEFAVRYPELVTAMVLICPSGMGDKEKLPIMEGVRRDNTGGRQERVPPARLVDRRHAPVLQGSVRQPQVEDGDAEDGQRGTLDHTVRDRLPKT